MKETIQEIRAFCTELSFPDDATSDLVAAYQKVMESRIAERFSSIVSAYKAGENPKNWKEILAELTEAEADVGVSKYTLHLLLFVVLATPLLARYTACGLSKELWKNGMEDLRCKLYECRRMYGVNGSFVASWFPRFFEVTRFGLGRLEFETDRISGAREICGETYPAGTPVIKVHIPSKGKLLESDCIDSFAQAVAFYKQWQPDWVVDGKLLFSCHSWLLDPRLATVLPETSNILKFAALFTISETSESEVNDCMWRIYYADCKKPPEELPRETTLQAAYADFLLAGNIPGEGYGFRVEKV